MTADNVAQITQAGRARWKIENEHFNTLTNHGYGFQHNFGHSLANLLATLHLVLDCVCDHWCRGRARSGARREFCEELRFLTKWFCLPSWSALLEAVTSKRLAAGLATLPGLAAG